MYERALVPDKHIEIPIVYVLELGGEEYVGVRDKDGNFTPTVLGAVPRQEVQPFGSSLGLQSPCVAGFVNVEGKPAGGVRVAVMGGRPACESIWSSEEGLTSSLLRQIPIATLVREAIISNTVRLLISGKFVFGAKYVEGGPGFGQLHDDLQKELATVDEKARRRTIDDRFLAEVAELYRQALHDRRPPARAVEIALGPATPTTARRWIAAARAGGFLGPAPAVGVAGEVVHEESVSS